MIHPVDKREAAAEKLTFAHCSSKQFTLNNKQNVQDQNDCKPLEGKHERKHSHIASSRPLCQPTPALHTLRDFSKSVHKIPQGNFVFQSDFNSIKMGQFLL